MSTLFISDLHLKEVRSDITKHFLHFLEHKAPHCQALYILGDFFDVWVGDDAMGAFEHSIASKLRALSNQGVKIYLMHGNRDFAIGKTFCQLAGCQLLKDPMCLSLYGKQVVLSHGDVLCTKDVEYQKKRRFFRNPFILFILLHLPLTVRKKIARNLREESMSVKQGKAIDIMDVEENAVRDMLKKYQSQLLIHGHTHRPAIHDLSIDGLPAKRIVLGDWEPNGQILRMDEDGFCLEKAVEA